MSSSASIVYTVTPSRPAAHEFTVSCVIASPDPKGQTVRLPTWIPGSYMIREFAKNIVSMSATCEGADVGLTALDKSTWQAEPCVGPLTITITVYAWDLSVRMAHLDQTHGYFNGTSLFLEVIGQSDSPHTVVLRPPTDPACQGWEVATTLPRAGAEPWSFGRYEAADYDELIDHPVEMGTFDRVSFDVLGVPHHVAITGQHETDMERLTHDLEAICREHITFFGEPAPMDNYLFQVMVVGKGYGGLEHRASTSLICSRADLPTQGMTDITKGYRKFLGLCSHEYFHTWNVKRIKPAAFVPFDLSREAHTSLLWAFEGITSYYDDLGLLRSKRIDTKSYLELLGQSLTRVYSSGGRHRQSVGSSSFDAWTKFYRQDENARNAIVSYYTKGAMVALCLDLVIRSGTEGRCSLDDVMARLWANWQATGSGLAEDELERVAMEVSGLDLTGFFDQAVRGVEDPDVAGALQTMGITLHLRAAESDEDAGGTAPKKTKNTDYTPSYLGARLRASGKDVAIASIDHLGPATEAGMSAGDVIVACDGLRVNRADLIRTLKQKRPGDTVELLGFRRDELQRFNVTLTEPPRTHAYLTLDDQADAETRARRDAWLG